MSKNVAFPFCWDGADIYPQFFISSGDSEVQQMPRRTILTLLLCGPPKPLSRAQARPCLKWSSEQTLPYLWLGSDVFLTSSVLAGALMLLWCEAQHKTTALLGSSAWKEKEEFV